MKVNECNGFFFFCSILYFSSFLTFSPILYSFLTIDDCICDWSPRKPFETKRAKINFSRKKKNEEKRHKFTENTKPKNFLFSRKKIISTAEKERWRQRCEFSRGKQKFSRRTWNPFVLYSFFSPSSFFQIIPENVPAMILKCVFRVIVKPKLRESIFWHETKIFPNFQFTFAKVFLRIRNSWLVNNIIWARQKNRSSSANFEFSSNMVTF